MTSSPSWHVCTLIWLANHVLNLVPTTRAMLVRVRLRFESTPLHYAQKCWFTFDREKCRLVGDVAHLIGSHFGFNQANIQLYMDDFLVPTNEKADAIRDNDLLEVRLMDASNGMKGSSPSTASSSPELQPPKTKRFKPIKISKPVKKNTPIQKNQSAKTNNKNAVAKKGTANKVSIKAQTQPATNSAKPDVKKLHISQTRTASGGVHLTFTSTSSSSSNSDSESKEESQITTTPINNSTTTNNQPSNTQTQQQSGSKSTRRGRGRRSRGQRGRRSLPANLVVGGPDDLHTTKSTVYGNDKETGLDLRVKLNALRSPHTGLEESDKVPSEENKSGWDVRPVSVGKEDVPEIIEPPKDYSSSPALDGAPRVGDNLAFKLLELSGSCTPEVSNYKEASVLAYDNMSKTLKLKYKQPPKTDLEITATSRLAQFALDQESTADNPLIDEVELTLDSLISPKLVTPT